MRRSRLRRSAVAYWTAAIALAVVTGVFIAGLVRGAEERAAQYGSVRRVLVARRSLAAGAVLRRDDFAARAVPRAFLPAGSVETAPLGRTVVVPLVAGEVLLRSKLAPEGLRGVAALLFKGERALAVPVGPGTPPLALGDVVDVLATAPEDGATHVVAHDGRVVGVDDRAVTVAIDVADTPDVAGALAAATVTLALAAP